MDLYNGELFKNRVSKTFRIKVLNFLTMLLIEGLADGTKVSITYTKTDLATGDGEIEISQPHSVVDCAAMFLLAMEQDKQFAFVIMLAAEQFAKRHPENDQSAGFK